MPSHEIPSNIPINATQLSRTVRVSAVTLMILAGVGLSPAEATTLPPLAANDLSTPSTINLGIQQAIEQALTQNPMLQQSQAMIDQAKGAIQEANGNRLPQLDLSFGAMASNNALNVFGMKLNQGAANFNDFGVQQFFTQAGPTFGNLAGASAVPPDALNHPGWDHNFQTSLKLSIPIYNGGKIRGLRDQAQALLQAAQSGDVAAKQQLMQQVISAYAAIDAAQAFVGVTRQAVDAANSYLNLSDKLYKQGVVSKSDSLKSEVNAGDIELRHQEAINQLSNAKDGLRILIGMPSNQSFKINELINLSKPKGTLEEARSFAMQNNPQIVALTQQIDAARSGVSSARSVYKPQFNLMAQQDWNSRTLGLKNDSYTVGGVFSWKILDFGARSGQVERAVADLSGAQSRQLMAINTLLAQVGASWRAAELADYRLRVKKLAITQSEEAARLEKLRYEQGLSTLTNLLQTQAELDKSRAELVQAQYELIVQRTNLLLALGQLEPAAIQTQPLISQTQFTAPKGSTHYAHP
ncbi:MAG: hypothetical protein B7X12_01855 [Halothiobacillus sp. 20-53-49]|nr:TolC family protein [Halothiobacillaceae bacterium]OYV47282.1 MAG: hypothetical protein B7X12_01855 [Halothiobacillus sp. 20-53-49]HUM98865.1 TolC family protein [Halothiobacillus sp.]